MSDALATLRRAPLFAGLPDSLLTTLARRARSRRLVASELLFLEGEQAVSFALVCSGRLEVSLANQQGREIVFDTVEPRQTVGELPLLDKVPHAATCAAQQSSEVQLLGAQDLWQLMQYARFRDNLSSMMRRKLKYLIEKLHYYLLYNLEARVAFYIDDLLGSQPDDSTLFFGRYTREDCVQG